jgi:hypothetical protein
VKKVTKLLVLCLRDLAGYDEQYRNLDPSKSDNKLKFLLYAYFLYPGVFTARAMRPPPIKPAIGIVMIHEKNNRPTRCQFTALNVPLHNPTPTVAPVMHIEVDTGSLYWEKMRIVIDAPISIDEPREGEW